MINIQYSFDHFIIGGFVDPDMNKTQKKYAPAYEPAYQPPQQTVIVQNVHFGPRPVSKIEQKECRWLTF